MDKERKINKKKIKLSNFRPLDFIMRYIWNILEGLGILRNKNGMRKKLRIGFPLIEVSIILGYSICSYQKRRSKVLPMWNSLKQGYIYAK